MVQLQELRATSSQHEDRIALSNKELEDSVLEMSRTSARLDEKVSCLWFRCVHVCVCASCTEAHTHVHMVYVMPINTFPYVHTHTHIHTHTTHVQHTHIPERTGGSLAEEDC